MNHEWITYRRTLEKTYVDENRTSKGSTIIRRTCMYLEFIIRKIIHSTIYFQLLNCFLNTLSALCSTTDRETNPATNKRKANQKRLFSNQIENQPIKFQYQRDPDLSILCYTIQTPCLEQGTVPAGNKDKRKIKGKESLEKRNSRRAVVIALDL